MVICASPHASSPTAVDGVALYMHRSTEYNWHAPSMLDLALLVILPIP